MIVTVGIGLAMVVTSIIAVSESSWRIAVAPFSMLPLFAFFAWALVSSRRRS